MVQVDTKLNKKWLDNHLSIQRNFVSGKTQPTFIDTFLLFCNRIIKEKGEFLGVIWEHENGSVTRYMLTFLVYLYLWSSIVYEIAQIINEETKNLHFKMSKLGEWIACYWNMDCTEEGGQRGNAKEGKSH